MDLQINNHQLSLGLCLILGALHALEPGHGKSALAAHLLSEKRNFLRPILLALSTAFSHAFSILAISIMVHALMHVAVKDVSGFDALKWLNFISGAILLVVGCFIYRKQLKPSEIVFFSAGSLDSSSGLLHGGGCKCKAHKKNSLLPAQPSKSWKTVAIGFAVGLIPCPTALVALSSALTSGNLGSAVMIVLMFSTGIFISLTILGGLINQIPKLAFSSERFGKFKFAHHLQFGVLTATGLWHMGSVFV